MMSKSVEKRLASQLRAKMTRLKADVIREDGRLERVCKEHGVGHTVGHVNHAMIHDAATWVHGCCGCCRDWPREE